MAMLEAFVYDPLINWRLLAPSLPEGTVGGALADGATREEASLIEPPPQRAAPRRAPHSLQHAHPVPRPTLPTRVCPWAPRWMSTALVFHLQDVGWCMNLGAKLCRHIVIPVNRAGREVFCSYSHAPGRHPPPLLRALYACSGRRGVA